MPRFITNLVFLSLLVVAGFAAYNQGLDTWKLWEESKGMKLRIAELAGKKEELEAKIAELRTVEAVRREAKERFNLKLPGENVAVVLNDAEVRSTSTPPETWGFYFKKLLFSYIPW